MAASKTCFATQCIDVRQAHRRHRYRDRDPVVWSADIEGVLIHGAQGIRTLTVVGVATSQQVTRE